MGAGAQGIQTINVVDEPHMGQLIADWALLLTAKSVRLF
jgi:hypothetical protein